MTELPPYTGKTEKPAANPTVKTPAKPRKPAAAPVEAPPVQPPPPAHAPVVPGPPAAFSVVWHSRVVLFGVIAAAAVSAILTAIGSANFPSAAPVEGLYAIGLIVDLVAVVLSVGAVTIVEFVRRGNADRALLPVNRRPSVFAIIAVALAAIALIAWAAGGGFEQFVYLAQGLRTRYMYATGSLFVAGIPWALAAIFGALGFRPRGNTATNVLAVIAIVIWVGLAALTVTAAIVYGLGLSD